MCQPPHHLSEITMERFQDDAVKEVFKSYSHSKRQRLMEIREIMFEVSREVDEVGPISEKLRWGQPSYLTQSTMSGTTVRIGEFESEKIAVYFHCRTSLVDTFRDLFHDQKKFQFSKNRAIVLDPNTELPKEDLKHCIHLAMTYHLKK